MELPKEIKLKLANRKWIKINLLDAVDIGDRITALIEMTKEFLNADLDPKLIKIK